MCVVTKIGETYIVLRLHVHPLSSAIDCDLDSESDEYVFAKNHSTIIY